MDLTKDNANKILCVNESSVIILPAETYKSGDMLMMFNNSDNFISLLSRVEKTYVSGSKLPRTAIEWPPRTLVNVVFIQDDLAVVKVEV